MAEAAARGRWGGGRYMAPMSYVGAGDEVHAATGVPKSLPAIRGGRVVILATLDGVASGLPGRGRWRRLRTSGAVRPRLGQVSASRV